MIISPSFLTCDFSNLKEEISLVSNLTKYLHVDVMDGNFVPNITLGPKVVKDLRKHFDNVFDVHLMISNPLQYIEEFASAGSDIITFHYEANSDILQTIKKIKECNKLAGLSINPNTNVEEIKPYLSSLDLVLVMSVNPGFGGQKFMENSVDKIKELDSLRKEFGYDYLIEVDGGINNSTIKLVNEANCDIAVCGSFLMNSSNKEETIKLLME